MTLSASHPRAKQRWTVLGALLVILTLLGAMASQAALNTTTIFELDKDAANDTVSTKIGVLNAAVSNATTANTIQVCQDQSGAYSGTVLIDAERMTLGTMSNLSGGGCPTGFTNKRQYNVTRPVAPTVRGAHAKAENVTLLVPSTHAGDDWDDVFGALEGGDDVCETIGAAECTFTADGRSASIFTSSKDYDEIEFWQWRDQSVPDANELDHGFAVKYVDGGGDQNLYFGADRFATEGSKDAGFWFFKSEVLPVAPVGGADGTFTGAHTAPEDTGGDGFCNATGEPGDGFATPNCSPYDENDLGGDVLILTTFTGGGAVTTVRVYEWVGPAGSVGALLERSTSGDCALGNTTSVCATVNNTTIESPWDYSGKNEPALNQIAAGGFLEGGINLTDLGLEGCFSSFMATTRSSPSLTADPKDFILDDFEACDTDLTTTPSNGGGTAALTDTNGNGIVDAQLQTGDDGVDVTDSAVIDVKGTTTWEGTLDFYLCGPINPPVADDPNTEENEEVAGDLCETGGVKIDDDSENEYVVNNGLGTTYVSDVATLTEVGYYCWRGEFLSGTDGVPNATDAKINECFEVLPVQPTLSTQSVSCVEEEVEEETVVTCTDLTDSVPFGEPIYDEANLGGTAYQPGATLHPDYPSIEATMEVEAGGTITFNLYGPLPDAGDFETTEEYEEAFATACATLASGFATAYPNGIGVTVEGDGTYNTFGQPFEPEGPGVYAWKAAYDSADANTLDATHNDDCLDANELVTIEQLQPTMGTEQSFIPNDKATITVDPGAGDLDGSVTFYVWVGDTTCGADTETGDIDLESADGTFGPFDVLVADEGTDPLVGSAESDNDGDTENGGVKSYDDGETFHWIVVFESDNEAHLDVTSGCGNEHSSIDIDNGEVQPAAGG